MLAGLLRNWTTPTTRPSSVRTGVARKIDWAPSVSEIDTPEMKSLP